MTNQVFSWAAFVAPWLTLFFMKREYIKSYMPVAILAAALTTIIHDIGITLGFWVVRDNAYPLYEMLPYFYGLIPVLTMWIFRFTNDRLWFYIITNLVLDIGFVYYFLGNLLPARGIYALVGIARPQVLLINIVHFMLLYLYQKWQEGELLPVKEKSFGSDLQAAVAKPFPEQNRDEEDNQ